MDYVRPLEAVIRGVPGRVLGVLSRTETELTMRAVARLAGVSPGRANLVVNRLLALGLVERREAGPAALVSLVRDNEAVRALLALANLWDGVMARLRREASTIDPAPASLVIFGSFASRTADESSDVDVLAVRPVSVAGDDPRWVESLGRWTDRAARIIGNPINLIEASIRDIVSLRGRQGSIWEAAARRGVVLYGVELIDLSSDTE